MTQANNNSNNQANLLAQIQPLLTILQALNPVQQTATSTNTNSTLLATHEYLAGEQKRARRDESDATIDEDTIMAGPSKPKTTVLPPEIQVIVLSILTAKIILSKIKRKKGKATLSVLAGRSISYDILEDLAATKADITIGQLI